MKWLGGVVLALALCVAPGRATAQTAPPAIRYALILRSMADTAVVFPALKRWGMTVVPIYQTSMAAVSPGAFMQFDGQKPFLLLDSLQSMRGEGKPLIYAEYDQSSRLTEIEPDSVPDVPSEGAVPWNVAMVKADLVQARGLHGKGQTVMIMDTGLDCDHPALNVRGGYAFETSQVVGGDPAACASWDDNIVSCKGHGTHVAGIVQMIADSVKLFGAKVFNKDCGAWAGTQMAAIQMAADSGLSTITSSISGGGGGAVAIIMDRANARGTWIAGAAGNTASVVQGLGSYSIAISVGSLNNTGLRSSYSGQGGALDIMAPGNSIYSTMPGGGYGTKSGTSMAGPVVSGITALMKERDPGLTNVEWQLAITRTAVDKGAPGWDAVYGWGLIDALAIDDYLIAHPGHTMPPPTYVLPRDSVTLSETTTYQQLGSMWDTTYVSPEIDNWTAVIDPLPVNEYGYAGIAATSVFTNGPAGRKGILLRAALGLGIPTYHLWLMF